MNALTCRQSASCKPQDTQCPGLKDVPGIAVMRTVAMLINEAADAVNQGVATVADVDTAMRKGVNYPRGPLAWADDLGVKTIQMFS